MKPIAVIVTTIYPEGPLAGALYEKTRTIHATNRDHALLAVIGAYTPYWPPWNARLHDVAALIEIHENGGE